MKGQKPSVVYASMVGTDRLHLIYVDALYYTFDEAVEDLCTSGASRDDLVWEPGYSVHGCGLKCTVPVVYCLMSGTRIWYTHVHVLCEVDEAGSLQAHATCIAQLGDARHAR